MPARALARPGTSTSLVIALTLARLPARVALVDDERPASTTDDGRSGLLLQRLQRTPNLHDDVPLVVGGNGIRHAEIPTNPGRPASARSIRPDISRPRRRRSPGLRGTASRTPRSAPGSSSAGAPSSTTCARCSPSLKSPRTPSSTGHCPGTRQRPSSCSPLPAADPWPDRPRLTRAMHKPVGVHGGRRTAPFSQWQARRASSTSSRPSRSGRPRTSSALRTRYWAVFRCRNSRSAVAV
jgi:hypothetical protein